MAFATKKQRPPSAYGAIAAIPAMILAAFRARLDPLSRIELLIPTLFWGGTFIISSLQPCAVRS
jgi:hypothetical protein